MTEPFDDPEFRAALESAGVQYSPGLAAGMLEELKPLLLADGIDIDDPNPGFGVDEFNEALRSATERHNLSLFTPTGDDRTAALRLLAEFTLLLDAKQTQDAVDLLSNVGPYATKQLPSAGHLTGAALGLLDDWLPAERPFHIFYLPYPSFGRKAANDVLAAADHGESFAELGALTLRHGGEALMHGAALSVASYLLRRQGCGHRDGRSERPASRRAQLR